MLISDLSSDVCSSDLSGLAALFHAREIFAAPEFLVVFGLVGLEPLEGQHTRSQLAKMLIRQVFTHQSSGLRRIDRQERTLVFVHVWMLRFVHRVAIRSEEHTSELQSLMRISYAVFC